MPRTYQYIRTLQRVLDLYDYKEPFARFLSRFFKENKQMGSKDRRNVSRFAYHYFRLGKAGMHEDLLTRLVWAEFLCSAESSLVSAEKPEWIPLMNQDLDEKIAFLESTTVFRLVDVFPFTPKLSDLIDQDLFLKQYFVQPKLFLRIRGGYESRVNAILEKNNIPFEQISPQTLAFTNGTSLDQIKELKGLVEVQDLSSQRSLDHVRAMPGEHWWDACSGAGGKSLLLMDRFPNLKLLVSDIRPSILKNLDARFDAAGITNYRRKIIDLSAGKLDVLGEELFDGIILDAPCTGSGTWGRTPEMLQSFDQAETTRFSDLQKTMASRVLHHLKIDGSLVYITCSVFQEENEAIVQHLVEKHAFVLEDMTYLTGYQEKADTLFVAHLKKA